MVGLGSVRWSNPSLLSGGDLQAAEVLLRAAPLVLPLLLVGVVDRDGSELRGVSTPPIMKMGEVVVLLVLSRDLEATELRVSGSEAGTAPAAVIGCVAAGGGCSKL